MKSPSVPNIVASPKTTSPQYSLSGVIGAMNKNKTQHGFLSTFFGRSGTGTAERLSNYINTNPPSKSTGFQTMPGKGASVRQMPGAGIVHRG